MRELSWSIGYDAIRIALDFPKPVIEAVWVILSHIFSAIQNLHFRPFQLEIQSWKLFSLDKLIIYLSERWILTVMIFQVVRKCYLWECWGAACFSADCILYLPVVLHSSLCYPLAYSSDAKASTDSVLVTMGVWKCKHASNEGKRILDTRRCWYLN